MFCSPEHFALNGENLFQIIDDFIKRHEAALNKNVDIEYIMVFALQETFPCKAK
jgi:hypothetical protein